MLFISQQAVLIVGLALLAHLLVIAAVRVRVRIRRPGWAHAGTFGRGLSVIGFALALSSPALAQGQSAVSPSRQSRHAPAPPWSEVSGSPPPPPLTQTGESEAADGESKGAADEGEPAVRPGGEEPPPDAARAAETIDSQDAGAPAARTADDYATPSRYVPEPTAHPAGHPLPWSRPSPIRPLFPRSTAGDVATRADAMARHPAGKARKSPAGVLTPHSNGLARGAKTAACPGGVYEVERGDSLWSIAGRALGTDDASRIARYWPRIHRANRDRIGADPNLIHPGQVLTLPEECPG